jgi:hypothetical protein
MRILAANPIETAAQSRPAREEPYYNQRENLPESNLQYQAVDGPGSINGCTSLSARA